MAGWHLDDDTCVADQTPNNVTTNNRTNNASTNNATSPTNNTTNNGTTTGVMCAPGEYPCANDCCVSGEFCHEDACIERFVGRRCINDEACGPAGSCLTQQTSGITGGFCTLACSSTTPCPDGATCSELLGLCMADCTAEGMCLRTELACGSPKPDLPMGCYGNATGAGTTADSCVSVIDCSGGVDGRCNAGWPDGYCLLRCADDADCVAGEHCNSGFCRRDCSTDLDCRRQYGCVDQNFDGSRECSPLATGTGAVGSACAAPQACAGGEFGRCPTGGVWSAAGTCVLACGRGGTTCDGASDVCVTVDSAAVCLPECRSNADCTRSGFVCVDMGGVGVCLFDV